jgi:hypothetical protein
MEKLLKGNGLQLLGYKPMWYDSYYISLLSSKYKHGKNEIHFRGMEWISIKFEGKV